MPRDRALRRSIGILTAVVLHCTGVAAAPALEGAGQREEIGFVAQMQGAWVDTHSGLPLRVGDRIYVDSQLQREAPASTKDRMTVTLYVEKPDERDVVFPCTDGLICRAPIPLRPVWQQRQPSAPQRGSSLILILQAIAKVLTPDKPNSILTLSPTQRGGEPHRWVGLARLEGETLDVADLLEPYGGHARLPEPLNKRENLQVEFCPVTDAGVVQCPPSPTPLHALPWADSAPRQFLVAGMQPGLYLLRVCSTGGGHTIRSNVRALVLVLPAERFAMAAAEWQRMREAVNANATVDINRADELLVAGLVSLRRVWIP